MNFGFHIHGVFGKLPPACREQSLGSARGSRARFGALAEKFGRQTR
jgi:hypothetical protein